MEYRKSKTLLISHSKKFVFIHNYKVAGTSVRNVLSQFQSESYRWLSNALWLTIPPFRDRHWLTLSKHTDYQTVKRALGTKLERYKVFGFVRNPWDWEVSKYEYTLQNTEHFQHNLVKRFQGFDEYLKWRRSNGHRSQSSFFANEKNRLDEVQVLRIEDIEDVNHFLSQVAEQPVVLPQKNTTKRRDYREYYVKDDSAEIISEIYSEDIKRFGYRF